MICVEIELADDGSVKVGVCPPEQGEPDQGEKEYLQPAKSVEDALGTAKDLLSGDTGEQAQEAEAEFAQGYGPQEGAP